MDSRSLDRVGVYISRRDATRSFVNLSSSSKEVCGKLNFFNTVGSGVYIQ